LKHIPVDFTENKDAAGTYVCTACGHPLFAAAKEFNAGCGFPSFWLHLDGGVKFNPLSTYGRERIQLLCNHCGHHLGHLFPNKSTPTGVRYCINKEAIRLTEEQH
jgi:peptide-methionine (R)-S-oxide reductase